MFGLTLTACSRVGFGYRCLHMVSSRHVAVVRYCQFFQSDVTMLAEVSLAFVGDCLEYLGDRVYRLAHKVDRPKLSTGRVVNC